MLSKYFVYVTNTEEFKNRTVELIRELEGKKVLLYGYDNAFINLKNRYDFSKLDIVAIADKKFKEECVFEGLQAIPPEQIVYKEYDKILITNEAPTAIENYLKKTLKISEDKIVQLFYEDIPEEGLSYNYLEQYKFGKHLKELNKKLKNKSIVIYGAGRFFETVKKYYDLSQLNIVGISDKKFNFHAEDETCYGYKAYAPSELKTLNPDYILVATKFYINIIEDLYYSVTIGTKIKIKPLVKKDFITLLKEVWK